jgi:glycosyltransferase involved in cell wall biosynthesis
LSEAKILQSASRIESNVLVDDPGLSRLYNESKAENGVTIFIPNWNHRTYLPRSLRSALAAIGRLEEAGYSGELLVIDDASRDGSQKFLRTVEVLYQDAPLRTVFLERNLGLPRLRNLAMRMSRYRHVCMLDADNELVEYNLPLFLQSAAQTGAALVHGLLLDKREGRMTGIRSDNVASMRLTAGNYIDAFALVDAKKLLRVGGYLADPRLPHEDWEMVLHLIAEEEQVVFVPVVMGYYHLAPGSMYAETAEDKGPRPRTAAPEVVALLRRMFAQTGTREWDAVKVGRIYHPAVGYID